MNHNSLAQSLADHLRTADRMTWCDIQLGPAGSVRPDVYAMFKSFANPRPTSYECKVSLSDFRSDVTSGKWQAYLEYSAAVYFAVPKDLGVTRDDIPKHCGLMVFNGEGWRAAKKPVLETVTIPQDALIKLLIDGVQREGPQHRAWVNDDARRQAAIDKKFGKDVARVLQDLAGVRDEIRRAEFSAKRIIDRANDEAKQIRAEADVSKERAELCLALGLDPGEGVYRISQEIRKIKKLASGHPAIEHLRQFESSIKRALEIHSAKACEREWIVGQDEEEDLQ